MEKNIIIPENSPVTPTEKYTFNYTENELHNIDKQLIKANKELKTWRIALVLFSIIFCFLAFIIQIVSETLSGIFIGFAISIVVSLTYSYYIQKRSQKADTTRVTDKTYEYEIYEKYMVVNISNQKSTKIIKIPYSEITSVINLHDHYALVFDNQYYFLRKADLNPTSKVHSLR